MNLMENVPRPPAPPTPAEVVAWLDYEFEPLIRRRDDVVLPALAGTLAAHPSIATDDEETAALFVDNMKIAKALVHTAEDHEEAAKRPFLEARNAVLAWFRRYAEPITAAIDALDTIMLDRADRVEAQQRAAGAEGKAAELTRVRGIYGAVASVRTTWRWEVTDPDQVPREYLMVDPAKLRAAAKARDPATGRPLASIPGVRWVEQKSMGVR